MPKIYLDHTATTPLDPRVRDAMLPFLGDFFANPSSLHRLGAGPKAALEEARASVARLVAGDPAGVIFTSGATEANNLAVKGIAWGGRASGRKIVISGVEHLSVLNAARRLQRSGYSVEILPVDSSGLVDPRTVAQALSPGAIIISVNLASPEVGTVQPIKEIAAIAHARDVLLHCDATAAAGWIAIDVEGMGIDLLTLSAHNFYGPKGVGALYVRRGVRLVPLLDGGPQEGGLRAGTENVPGVVGMGKAAELASAELPGLAERLLPLRDRMIAGFEGSAEGVYLTGHRHKRLPGHASFCVRGIEGEALLTDFDMAGIAASSGSPCSSYALKISHVLEAMGVETTLARGSVALTLGRDATQEDVDQVIGTAKASIKRLRDLSPI